MLFNTINTRCMTGQCEIRKASMDIISKYFTCVLMRCCVFTDVKTMTHILRHHQQRDNTGLSTLSPLEQLTWPHSDVKLPCGIVPAQNVSSNWLQMKLKYVHYIYTA